MPRGTVTDIVKRFIEKNKIESNPQFGYLNFLLVTNKLNKFQKLIPQNYL